MTGPRGFKRISDPGHRAERSQGEFGTVETRNMFEYFDKDWSPPADPDAVEARWRGILSAHGTATDDGSSLFRQAAEWIGGSGF